MEEILQAGLTFTALSGIVYTITSAIYRTLPMDKLGEYVKGVKLLGAIMLAFGIAIGFRIDLSQAVVFSDPITPLVGYLFTGLFAGIGSAGVYTVTKQVR